MVRIASLRRVSLAISISSAVLLASCSAIYLHYAAITTLARLCLVLTLASVVFSILLGLSWFRRAFQTLIAVIVVVIVLFVAAIFFEGNPDRERLRSAYRAELSNYRGSHYIWGGETHTGIDCSGLARVAFWKAISFEGVKQFHARLLGPENWLFWWRDLTAADFAAEKYGYTVPIGKIDQLADYDPKKLRVGDMAVTADGIHVLIYYGNSEWIEANPSDRGVVVNRADPGSKRYWFHCPVTLVRWWLLN